MRNQKQIILHIRNIVSEVDYRGHIDSLPSHRVAKVCEMVDFLLGRESYRIVFCKNVQVLGNTRTSSEVRYFKDVAQILSALIENDIKNSFDACRTFGLDIPQNALSKEFIAELRGIGYKNISRVFLAQIIFCEILLIRECHRALGNMFFQMYADIFKRYNAQLINSDEMVARLSDLALTITETMDGVRNKISQSVRRYGGTSGRVQEPLSLPIGWNTLKNLQSSL